MGRTHKCRFYDFGLHNLRLPVCFSLHVSRTAELLALEFAEN